MLWSRVQALALSAACCCSCALLQPPVSTPAARRAAFCAEKVRLEERESLVQAAVPRGPTAAVRRSLVELLAERGFVVTREAQTSLVAHRLDEGGFSAVEVRFGPGAQFVALTCSEQTATSPVIRFSSLPTASSELKRSWLERFQPEDAARIAAVQPVSDGPAFDRCVEHIVRPRRSCLVRPAAAATAQCPPPPAALR